jgi:hypothetical protein
MLAEQYTKLLNTVSEFKGLTVSECYEQDDFVYLLVQNGGLYFAVQKTVVEEILSRYLGKKTKIHNNRSLFDSSFKINCVI